MRNLVIKVGSMIAGEMTILLKKLHRRLSSWKKAHNPWTAQVTRDLYKGFVSANDRFSSTVKKARSTYGVAHSKSRFMDIIV